MGAQRPLCRTGHSLTWNPQRDAALLFGGDVNGGPNDETWLLDIGGAAWTRLTFPGTVPHSRSRHTMTYDPIGARMVLHAGFYNTSSPIYFNDVWTLTLDPAPTWTHVFPSGPTAPNRRDHAAVYDEPRHRIVVFGGATGPTFRNDTWALRLDPALEWEDLTTTGPAARAGAAAIYDPLRDRVLIYGGGGLTAFEDLWQLASLGSTPVWSQLFPTGSGPGPRAFISAAYDPGRDRMLVFSIGEVWELALSVDPPQWRKLAPAGSTPGPILDIDDAFIFSRASDMAICSHGVYQEDTWALSFHGPVGVVDERAPVGFGSLRPNPARSTVVIPFTLAASGPLTLKIFDVGGRLVATMIEGWRPLGRGEVTWDLRRDHQRVAQGLYFAELRASGRRVARRFVVAE